MPSYERELDLVQGYNFKKDVQNPVGFITKLSIGPASIEPDQTISTPMNKIGAVTNVAAEESEGTLKVVSVLKKIKWDLGDTDPLEFEGTLSVTGKQMVMGLLYATMIDIQIAVSFVIYEYDPLYHQYYVAFSDTVSGSTDVGAAGAGVLGLIKKDGANLALTVSPTPSSDVQSPENYDFTLQVVPWPKAQPLYLAAASTRKVTKPWGRVGPVGQITTK